jgi:putative effector of murein hydrolase
MALGASGQTIMSLLPKSVTAPIAMGISEQIGGTPALTAVYCISTGVLGAVLAQYVFYAARIRSWLIQGFTLGIAAHGIGTARAFQQNVEAGAFAGLALGLHGLIAAVVIPATVVLIKN